MYQVDSRVRSPQRSPSARWSWAILCLLVTTGSAHEWFLSPSGDDAAAGSRHAPWRTLEKANHAVQPGDTVTFFEGAYEGTIEPLRSGTAGAPIVYRSERRLGAVLRGGSAESVCVRLIQREHIVIEGFAMRPEQGDLMRLDGARHCVVRHSRLEGGTSWSAILCTDSHYNRYEDLECGNLRATGSSGHVRGDCWTNRASSHNVFLRVHFSRVGHCPLNFWNDSPYNVVRDCTFDSRWGRNFEFFSTPHVLIEGCVVTNGFDGSGSADGRAKLFVTDSIFRRNLVFRNHYGPLVVNAYRISGQATFRMDRSRIYHNTWYRNYDGAFEMVAEESALEQGRAPVLEDNVFKNNLFADSDTWGDGVALQLDPVVAAQTRFLRNNFRARQPGAPAVRFDVAHPDWAHLGVDTWRGRLASVPEMEAQAPAQFRGNLDVEEGFVDAEHDDFRLRPDSACRDSGEPLAYATDDGAGTVLALDDVRWFYDGFGIPGEEGDLVMIGAARTLARVREVDTSNRRLVLDRSVTWKKGDGVSLPYTGSASDLGAYEQAGEAERWYRAPKVLDGLRLTPATGPTGELVRTDFETADEEAWFYLWNFSRQKNTNVALDASTAGDGARSLRVFATGSDAVLACDIKPREWDLERFPLVTFRYRIPAGVPVGIWLHAFRGAAVGRGMVCIGGTKNRSPGPYRDLGVCELVDDDRWHEVTVDARVIRRAYPGVAALQTFRFYTANDGKAGDQFWFDAFRIHRE